MSVVIYIAGAPIAAETQCSFSFSDFGNKTLNQQSSYDAFQADF